MNRLIAILYFLNIKQRSKYLLLLEKHFKIFSILFPKIMNIFTFFQKNYNLSNVSMISDEIIKNNYRESIYESQLKQLEAAIKADDERGICDLNLYF